MAARRLHSARAGADDAGAIVLLKGADTIVAAPGQGVLVADLGNPGLATAGSGDVLTGIVAAFLAKGVEQRVRGDRGRGRPRARGAGSRRSESATPG